VRIFLRVLADNRHLWRVYLPLLGLAALVPVVTLAMPLVERRLVDEVILAGRADLLLPTGIIYAALWLVNTVCFILAGVLRTYLGERLTMHLRRRLFAHSGDLSLAFSRREHSAQTMSLFLNDVGAVAGLFTTSLVGGLGIVVALAVGGAIMFRLNWQLAIVAAVIPPVVGVAAVVVTRPLRPAARRVQEKTAELTERVQEHLTGMREVVAFGRERAAGASFLRTLRELLRLRMRLTVLDSVFQAGSSVFTLALTLVIFGFGGYLVIQGRTTIGTLVAMQSLFGYALQPATQLPGLVAGIQRALGSAERVYAFLDERPLVAERAGAAAPHAVRGEVEFEGVSFAYRPDVDVLSEISFTARPGELIALVGPSGAGKTTLTNLLARFYDPTEGRICLDGVDLRDLTLAGLRAQVGLAFQDTFLFATTIGENIAFGRDDVTAAQVVAAAGAANAWEFIERLPEGLDTPVGERGMHLSEGQKQRLAIARALVRDPRILILDEPTAALDARSEHLLQAALDRAVRGRTTFVIAHRLATVQRADRILVLDRGRIVEQGTHAELLRRDGLYRELFELQFGQTTAGAPEVRSRTRAAARTRSRRRFRRTKLGGMPHREAAT
jgi:ABC-type multidrug transport system fused ATPase/permease subunit